MKLIESMACIGEIQMHLYCIELDNYVNKLLLYTTYSDLFINVCRCLSLGHVSSGSLTMSVAILHGFFRTCQALLEEICHIHSV